MAKTQRERKSVRSAQRRAAFHAERARNAATPVERYRAAENALTSAVSNASSPASIARNLQNDVHEHLHTLIDKAGISRAQTELYEQKLAQTGTDVHRLATVLMCLRGAIRNLQEAERDRVFDHYARTFAEETRRVEADHFPS